ncbi:MAG TPA: redoxin family protein [Tepidisphaeraceae bacterium]|nr:redoxin family protein [Tepidisphaeraceae bacterium]
MLDDFAMKRWAEKAGVTNVEFLSDHRTASFGQAFGMLLKDLRLLARGIFVLDRNGAVRYAQIVNELSQEPDYDAALDAAKQLV